MNIHVALVEDHASYRESMAALLSSTPGFACVAACPNARAAIDRLPAARPEVILMDLHLPGGGGFDCIRTLRALLPQARILMLTIEEHASLVFAALRAGASGYLLKGSDPARVIAAIREIQSGGAPMSAAIARLVIESFHSASPRQSKLGALTSREVEVLEHLARGWTSKEIADELSLSLHTILTHVRHIYEKLHVRSRAEAVNRWFAR
jgi:DNA-binding NarL/FixJ family response regulator